MRKKQNLKKVYIVLYVYWFVLLLWQNIRSVGNRGGVDTLIKAGLIMFLVLYFCSNVQYIKMNALFSSVILVSLASVTVALSSTINFRLILYYFYPVFLFFIIYAVGSDAQISKKQLISFLHWVIITVAYIVIYAIIFCRDQFASAFSISSAYGNELSSFLVSNHEYGMYLAYGILAIFLCGELSESVSLVRRFLYIVGIITFAVNLILTFSRTSIIAFVAMLTIYMIYYAKKTTRNKLVLAVIACALAIIFVPQFKLFLINIVFKDGANSGRDELAQIGFSLYGDATWFQKFFGNADFNAALEKVSEHSNLHNGYIQMLLTNGIKGVVFLVAIMATTFYENHFMKRCSDNEKKLCKMFNGFLIASGVFMLTTTSTLFYSSIDSYFLTLFAIIIPKYVRNAIKHGNFD